MGTRTTCSSFGAGAATPRPATDNAFLHTLDAQWENTAASASTARLGVGSGADQPAASDAYDWGVLVQGELPASRSKWEVFGRYDFTFLDDDAAQRRRTRTCSTSSRSA